MFGKSQLSRINSSSSRILGAPSYMRGNEPISELNKKRGSDNIPQVEEEIEENAIQVSQSVSEADPYDFGYYKLVRKVQDNKDEVKEFYNPNKSQLFNVMQNAIRNVNKFSIKKMNLIKSMNEIEYDERNGHTEKIVKNNKELIYNFAREENDYKNFIIPCVADFKTKILQKGRTNTMSSKKSEKLPPAEILQTDNSYVIKKQNYE
jgi:hypothetical protein